MLGLILPEWLGGLATLSTAEGGLARPCTQGAVWGLSFAVQSTVLILVGLLVARAARTRGPATESVALRMTLLAVVVSPLVWWSVRTAGMETFTVAISSTQRISPAVTGPAPRAGYEPAADRVASSPAMEDQGRHASGLGLSWVALAAVGAAGAWAATALLLLARLAQCHLHVQRCVRSARSAPGEVVRCCASLAGRIGVRPPAVLVSPLVATPALVGVRSPAILLPAQGSSGKPSEGLEAVLLHELAHLKRRDVLWNWLGHLVCALGFFQPLLWVLARRLEDVSDVACDDYVVHFGGRGRPYALELFRWATLSRGGWREAVAGAGVVRFRSSLGQRTVRILDDSLPRALEAARGIVLAAAVATVLCLGASALCGFRLAQAEGPPPVLPEFAPTPSGDGEVSETLSEPRMSAQQADRSRAEQDAGVREREPGPLREAEPRREVQGVTESGWTSEKAYRLYRQGQELRQRGQTDAGNGLVEQAERLERSAREERVRREAAAKEAQQQRAREFTSDQAYELVHQAEGLAREGKRAEAEEVMARARRAEQEYRARDEPRERPGSARRE